jgi:hypothetical protein
MTRFRTALALTACGEKQRVVTALKPPAERLQCIAAGERPSIPAEHAIDWSKVRTVEQAKAEHLKYVGSIRSREGVIVGYIVRIEGQLFTCADNAAWLRDFFAGVPG